QAQRQLGDLEAAAAAFDQAILRHALPMGDNLDRTLAPGQRADDSYRAARVAIDRGDLEGAWQLLEALDRLAAERFGACDDETQVSQQDRAARRRALLAQLAWTEPPLAVARSQQVRPIRRALLQALDDLHREQLAVCRRPARRVPAPADVRAFALPDEVLVLRRVPAGYLVAWRTSLARAELRRWLDQIATAQAGGELDDAAWRSLVRPVATALLAPDAEPFAAVTRFALHGVLQRVPLPALPIAAADGERWLAELTTVVRSPALVETPLAAPDRAAAEPLFVVDPQRNLPSGATARATYRERFGTARILFGEQASLQAVREALPSAAFLHIDAHGSYDEAFPELSRLQMSDGFLTASDLATQAGQYRFVNLSGCHTGRVTPTGDSGHQGLAGVLARRGAPWVIAHRSATFDRLGGDFNRAFYREIDRGRRVLEAFRNAHGELRQHYPAAAWSNLMLWGAGSEAKPERRGLPEG
ncbi:MAG: CHAT domain-containing protein, partial [Acidobacteriota bacterium]